MSVRAETKPKPLNRKGNRKSIDQERTQVSSLAEEFEHAHREIQIEADLARQRAEEQQRKIAAFD